MLSYSLLITLLGLTNAAPMRLPMPHTHRRDTLAPPFAPRSFQDERPRLLDLDLGLGLDSVLPNLDLDLGLGLDLTPILDVDLGISLDLEVGGWLTCNSVNGAFGGRRYDLGCTCIGSSGDLLLDVDVDVDALVNAQGLDVWVKSQVQLGLGFYYPSGARPICDGNGGWTCPGNCGGSSSQPPSISTALSQSRPAPTSSSTSASVTSTPTAISTSSAAPTSTSFVVQDVPSSSIWTSSSTQSTWAPSSFSTWKASSWVPISSWAAVSSWAPSSTWTPSSTSDSHISAQNTQIPGQSYGYTPPVATTTVTPTKTEAAWTVYEGATTMTLPTVFMVDHTETVTLTKTITVTEKSAPQATVTVTETVHDGECFTEESVPISTSWIPSTTSTPSSTWSTQSSPWTSSITPTSSTWTTASALAQTLPPPSSTFSWTPSPTPTVGIVDDCPKGQKFDITLQICLDICLGLGVLDDAGLCVDLDTGLGVDLPILGPIIGGAKDVLGNDVLAGLGGVGPGGVGSLGELGGIGGLGGLL